MNFLSYDDRNMWADRVGSFGATIDEYTAMEPQLTQAVDELIRLNTEGIQGFLSLPDDQQLRETMRNIREQMPSEMRVLFIIGIGGSDLGARALYQSLGAWGRGVELRFLSNPDPDYLHPILSNDDPEWWKGVGVCVISKSGGTLETMSIFLAVRAQMKAVLGADFAKHIWTITEPSSQSTLYKLATSEQYTVIEHPMNVGGRFSVLSSVGLFPAVCADIDIERLHKGAKWVADQFREHKQTHMSVRHAALHFLAMKQRGQAIHVLMPYSNALQPFAQWYRQIWAESLGKKRGDGHVGPTPVASLGPVDQHSQVQLYNEGPNDKTITCIEVDEFTHTVPAPLDDPTGMFGYLENKTFEEIMHASRKGTTEALTKHMRPNGTLHIPGITPESIGGLIMFYEISTAICGSLLGINAYDQPGVEEGKKQTKQFLGA